MVKLSDRAIKVISDLEFQKKYYFTKEDIEKHFESKKQIYNFIHNQKKNNRIVKLNRNKYFLIPMRARYGKWTDHPLIIADEIMNSKEYYVGGWYSAHYWQLTEQIPLQVDIYTTRRQGEKKLLNKRFVFHRIRKKALDKGVKKKINNHSFVVQNKSETEKWLSKR